jgi:hypothetical protein
MDVGVEKQRIKVIIEGGRSAQWRGVNLGIEVQSSGGESTSAPRIH